MRNALRHRSTGWAVPVVCLTLALGGSLLAAALQRTTNERERSTAQAWQVLQAEAAAEGILARTLALLDDPRPVDGSCVPRDTALNSGYRFTDRYLKAGARMGCLIDHDASLSSASWACACRESGEAALPLQIPTTNTTTNTTMNTAMNTTLGTTANSPRTTGWAELRVEAASPLLRLNIVACVLPPTSGSATAGGATGVTAPAPAPTPTTNTAPSCGSGTAAGMGARSTVLLRPDGKGNWRMVVGSWTDAG